MNKQILYTLVDNTNVEDSIVASSFTIIVGHQLTPIEYEQFVCLVEPFNDTHRHIMSLFQTAPVQAEMPQFSCFLLNDARNLPNVLIQ